MHLELAVPGLLGANAADRLPSLELLLARARQSKAELRDLESWFSFVFSLENKNLPAGALSALGAGLDPGDSYWLRADPVHLRADRDRLLLFPSHAFPLSGEEADLLRDALDRHFSDRFVLKAPRPDAWVLQTEIEADLQAKPPLELTGANVDAHLPDKRWHALLNEIQMALYEHPVNTEREERGDPVVNSLWLWGGGRLPAAARGPWQSVSAEDPVALGLARLANMRSETLAGGAADWLARAPTEGRHLVVLDALRGPRALGDEAARTRGLRLLEERWFAPLLAALKAERIGMVTIHVPDAGLAFETIRGDLRRFWRRPRPLSEYSAGGDSR